LKRGKNFRIVADIIVDGENLADLLIEAGMSIKYNGGKQTHK
jgi:micrococcal nuclease